MWCVYIVVLYDATAIYVDQLTRLLDYNALILFMFAFFYCAVHSSGHGGRCVSSRGYFKLESGCQQHSNNRSSVVP
jgi:hypothetical protein